ncbi:hypothetical protein [Peredibacter starrii]|uniref:Uncharacterized protein n=1 Tax=Peredibacter starrii TaxID=28202 RepID=A0AAX4HL41_9BACT|nr:hypothetical protein [Peredibacter starrii]WPU63915.1 hypothetical protein SOO65_14565 [Peredibacter starrii]
MKTTLGLFLLMTSFSTSAGTTDSLFLRAVVPHKVSVKMNKQGKPELKSNSKLSVGHPQLVTTRTSNSYVVAVIQP